MLTPDTPLITGCLAGAPVSMGWAKAGWGRQVGAWWLPPITTKDKGWAEMVRRKIGWSVLWMEQAALGFIKER